jgi:hypothetical protein
MTARTLKLPEAVSPGTRLPALRAADWLCLAAAPTFAIMALLTAVLGAAQPDMHCSAAGMIPMYLLMSAFHSPPWLKLIFGRGMRRPRGRSYA